MTIIDDAKKLMRIDKKVLESKGIDWISLKIALDNYEYHEKNSMFPLRDKAKDQVEDALGDRRKIIELLEEYPSLDELKVVRRKIHSLFDDIRGGNINLKNVRTKTKLE